MLAVVIAVLVGGVMLYPVGSTFEPRCSRSVDCENVLVYHSVGTMLLLRPVLGDGFSRLSFVTIAIGGIAAAAGSAIPFLVRRLG